MLWAVAYYTDSLTGKVSAVGMNSNVVISYLKTYKGVLSRACRLEGKGGRLGVAVVEIFHKDRIYGDPIAVYKYDGETALFSLVDRPNGDTVTNIIKEIN